MAAKGSRMLFPNLAVGDLETIKKPQAPIYLGIIKK